MLNLKKENNKREIYFFFNYLKDIISNLEVPEMLQHT
jgi:hypothetical protein